mgnify:CR=1 FL=1
MAEAQVQQLVKMAHQIALNLQAEGDLATLRAAEHIRKFWTRAMRERLVQHSLTAEADLPEPVQAVAAVLGGAG